MKHGIILVCFALVVICLLTASVGFAKPAGGAAFLPEFANTPSQISDQMEANRLVALRYARVFVSEPKAVLTYFRNELTLVTLDEPFEVKAYYLDESGRIVSETRMLKAGTKVFANRAGFPVLEYGTGNPLTSDLPAPDKPRPKAKPITQANNNAPQEVAPKPAAQPAKPVVAKPVQPGTQSALATPSPSPVPESPLVTSTPGSTVAATPAGTVPATPTSPTSAVAGVKMETGGRSRLGGWVLPVGLAGAVAALAGGGGTGSGTNPTNGGGTLPLVPEPTSLMALGTGLTALGGLIGRKRRH